MSTRGLIAIIDEDGSCRSIYCHHDMYPSHAGKVLTEHYFAREAVERLLSLGDLSSLGDTLDKCEAYSRDRGEELHRPTLWADRWQLSREAFDRFWANYAYLFMDGVWHVSAGQGWMPVAELMMLGRFDYLAQPGGSQDFSPRPENLGMTELSSRAFRKVSRKMEKSPFSAS